MTQDEKLLARIKSLDGLVEVYVRVVDGEILWWVVEERKVEGEREKPCP